ncbi:MAG: ATP-binding protein [Burkholderiales bacterium]|nr:ATP-binding protein [Burkholderiales bacterium]
MRAQPRSAVSIRALLLAGTSAALLAVLGAAAWLSFDGAQEEAQELFDARLATSARVLEALVARQLEKATVAAPIVIALPGALEYAGHDEPGPLGHYYETKIAFQIRGARGALLARSASASQAPFAPLEPGFLTRAFGGREWRVFTLHSGDVWIQVAERDDVRSELSEKLALASAAPLIAGIPLLLVLLSLLIGYGLAPLSALARQVAARQPGSTAPLQVSRTPAEVAPLVEALNGLLARVRDALERERRFTADAAHELRTPLAALKVHAQNAARAASDAEREASLQRLLQATERTVHLAEQMLAYSRVAAPPDAARFEQVALQPLLADAVESVQPAALERGVELALEVEPSASGIAVRADRHELLSLVTNLLDNAVRYGPADARVRLELRRDGDAAALAVVDEGPGIPPELRARAFESYYRIPGSPGAGSGLGLAIVREVAEAHGARASIEDAPGSRGTRVVVTFPAA